MAFPVTVNLSQGKINTDPEEFKRFNKILMANAPEGYEPYYLALARNGKDPQPGRSWKQNRKTFEEAYSLMKLGFNIGIAGTDKDNLVIVDADDLEVVGKIKPTLTTISRKRIGRHGFYFTDDPLARTIYDNSAKQNIATEDAGEVRSVWQYVVCAGSYVSCSEEEIYRIPEEDRANAGKYSLLVENEVFNITYAELPEVYRVCLENKRAVDIANTQKKVMKPVSQGKDTNNKSAIWDLDIETVSGEHNNQTRRFPSPFHGSKTFKDTSVSHGMLHCWRHNCSHTALTYLAVASGISTCSQAGFPHGGGSSGVDMEDPETVFTIWKYAKDMGLIPHDDPIPQAAMRYIARKYGIHDCNNLEDGWKLPIETYNKVLEVCEKEGIETGRKLLENINGIKHAAKRLLGGISVTDVVNGLQEEVPIYFDNSKNFWMWNPELRVYERIDETEIMVQITEHLDLSIYTKDFKNQILEGIRQTGRLRRVKPTKKEWVQFANGVYDVETGKIFEATPDYFFVSQIPHRIGESEETPVLDKLFYDWQGDKADLLREIAAYCLYDDYPIQRIFAFVGPGGNGKGQFMTFIKRLLGHKNTVGTDLDRLSDSRFEAAKLFKKKAAFVGETNYTLSRTSLLKSLTGGDTISGEFKNRDPFDFVNTAKIIIATNGLPLTTDRSEGFYRRWCLVEFKNKFKDGIDIINTVPEVEYENFCRRALTLLKNIIEKGRLPHEPEQIERKTQYEKLSNPIQAFIGDECIVSDDSYIPVWYLFEKYNVYRETKGHRSITQNEFSQIVSSMGYVKKQKWFNGNEVLLFKPDLKSSDGKNWMAFEGLSINMNNDDDPERSRDTPVDSRGPSRIENEATNDGNIGENEKSRSSRNKPHLLLCRSPEQNIPLEPLGYGQNCSENTAGGSVFANSLNPSRIPIPSRISDDNCIAGNVDQGFSIPVLEQKTLTLDQSEENGIKSLSGSELMRADLKNFAKSRYNLMVDSVPVLVGEFNKEYPGYKQKYGLQAVLYNAEKLKERGWR